MNRNQALGLCSLVLVALVLVHGPAVAQADAKEPENPLSQIEWMNGPVNGDLGDVAHLKVPEGFLFTGAKGTQRFLEMTENVPSGNELGMLIPAEQANWFVIFTWADVGHVKDDEKSELDAAALLKSMREGQEQANAERAKRGWETMEIAGWDREPFYDPTTNNLTWATRIRAKNGGESVNWSTRLLGRSGYMNVDLVFGPEQLDAVTPQLAGLVGGFAYKDGQSYAEWRPGDKVAKYGLTALVAGGAAAAAAKTGLLGKMWKFIIIGLAAAGAGLKKLWAKLKGEERIEGPSQDPTA